MLEIDLVQGRPALKVDFRVSLAADLLHAISMVMDSPWYEGLDQWVYATHAALPPTLKSDMEAVLFLIQMSHAPSLWIGQLPASDPANHDFEAFVAWLDTLAADGFQDLIDNFLQKLAKFCEEEKGITPSLDDTEALKECLRPKLSEEQLERAIPLMHNPAELKAQFLSVITRFWEQFYRQEYERSLPLMKRSVEHHRRQNYGADFVSTFTAVTGRRLPKDRGDYEDVERVIFIPSCYIGPYVIFNDMPELRPTLILHYNCRTTGAPERDQVSAIQDLFPPLKALADETRLQILSLLDGRELYAQEIVDRLDISQSAVSRHLKLMVTGGLLKVRKKNSMKYFSISEETLAVLADRLKSFREKPS